MAWRRRRDAADARARRRFLATANFDRTLYDESCTFQDEIDTYELDKFIKGTSKPVSYTHLTLPTIPLV